MHLLLLLLIVVISGVFMINHRKTLLSGVIIEPRSHPALEYVVSTFLENLPFDEGWKYILIFHGEDNKTFLQNIAIRNPIWKKNQNRLFFKLLPNVKNLSILDYNRLLATPSFYFQIPTEYFLVFQTDSIVCPRFRHFVNDFVKKKYDYVGAPFRPFSTRDEHVGNGGLSLRKKSKMLEIIRKCPYSPTSQNEDLFFSYGCEACSDIKKPSNEEASRFSIESRYSEASFGVHKPWAFLSEDDEKKLSDQCSTYSRMRTLNTKSSS